MAEPFVVPEQVNSQQSMNNPLAGITSNPVAEKSQEELLFVPPTEEDVQAKEQSEPQLDFVPQQLSPDEVPAPYSFDDNRFLAQQAALAQSTIDPETGYTDFDKLVDSYNRRIMQGQELAIRKEIAKKVADRESAALFNLTKEAHALGENDPTILLDSIRMVAQLRADEDQYALEQRAVDQLVDFSVRNPDWALLQKEQPTVMDNIYEDLEKELIIQNEVSRWRALESNQDGILSDIFKDAPEQIGTLGIQPIVAKYGAAGGFRVGALMRERGNKIRNLPKEQIVPAMRSLIKEYEDASSWLREKNPDAVNEFLQNTFNATDETELFTSGGFFVEVVATVAGLGLVKGAKNLSKSAYALGKTGNTAKIADDAIRVLETRNISNTSSLYSVDEAVKNAIALRLPDEVMMGVSGKVRDQLAKQELIAQRIKSVYNVDRLTKEELAGAVAKESDYINQIYKDGSVLDISYHYNVDKNMYELHYNLANEAGNPYASRELAQEAMANREITGEVFQYEDGGWYIRGIKEIQEEGVIEGIPDIADMPTGMVKRALQDQRSIVSKFIGAQGTASVQNDARLSSLVTSLYKEGIGGLGPKEFKHFNEIADASLSQEKWFSPSELHEMLLAKGHQKGTKSYDKITTAYYTGRQISDADFFIANRDLYTNAARRGLREIELFDPNIPGEKAVPLANPFNGKEIKDLSRFKGKWEKQIIYDVDKKEFVRGSKEYIKEALERGKTIVAPEDATFTKEAFGTPATILVGSKKSINVKDLSYQQLAYVAGGRRVYRNVFFVGQTRKGVFPDNLGGGKYALRPNTLFTAPTRKQAEKFTEVLNKSLHTYKQYSANLITREAADLAIKDSFKDFNKWGIKNLDDLDRFVGENHIDLDTPIHVRGDREAPALDDDDLSLFDEENIEFQVTSGNRFNKSREHHINNIYGDKAEALSFSEALRKTVDTAVKSGAYNDVRISAMERFAKEFGKKHIMTFSENASPYDIVAKGQVNKALAKTNPQLYERAKTMQFYVNSLLKTESTWDMKLANATMRFADWVEGKNIPFAKKVAQKVSEKGRIDPIAKLRSYNFNFSLGMFNPRQLFLQAQSMVTSVSLDPIRGLAASRAMPFFRYALYQSEKSFDLEMASRGWRLAGFKSKEEMASAIEQFRNIGANDFGSTIGQIDATNSLGMGGNWLMNKASRVNEAGKVFFNEGERYGRITAYEIARRRWTDNVGNVNPKGIHFTDKEAASWIREEYNRILFSPNASDNPLFTKGLASLPTQFWSYQAKLLNAMLPKIGSRNYTTAEKMKLIAGQVLFYGTTAVPLFEAIADKFLRETGTELDPTTYKFMTNGLIDGLIYAVSGGNIDTDVSGAASVGGFFDMVKDAATESPLIEILGGATMGNISRGFQAMAETAKMHSLWENPKLSTVGLMGYEFLANTIATEKIRTKAMLAWNTGMLFDRHGGQIGRINKAESALMFFGIPPAMMNKTFKGYEDLKMTDDDILANARILNKLHMKWKLATSDQEKKIIEESISLFSASMNDTGYGDKIAQKALQLQKRSTLEDKVNQRLQENYLRDPKTVLANDLPPNMKQIREGIYQELVNDGIE